MLTAWYAYLQPFAWPWKHFEYASLFGYLVRPAHWLGTAAGAARLLVSEAESHDPCRTWISPMTFFISGAQLCLATFIVAGLAFALFLWEWDWSPKVRAAVRSFFKPEYQLCAYLVRLKKRVRARWYQFWYDCDYWGRDLFYLVFRFRRLALPFARLYGFVRHAWWAALWFLDKLAELDD